MKLTSIFFSLLLCTSTVMAERAALIHHKDEWNLFSKFEVSASEIDGNSAAFGGITVGGLLNDAFGIGIAGQILLNNVETDSALLNDIEGGDVYYGGGYLEYVFNSDNLVYASLDLLVGGGHLEVNNARGESQSEGVFIAEPGLNVMINITERFQFGLGGSYRFAGDVDIEGLDNGALSDWNGTAFLRFTQF